ncbi:ORF057 [Saltwater crocodilepox virus]|nr:ORF057 [Saltwater crocodilepox virus]QGT47785.1 ORF057 [Saltwater crocodilepox virus]QGT47996.1 ORF057 [Saltwater crocodilepox virus]QGT48209.1 ORF057 [Saltwater crocodilepox virus]QGT48425.1 ORF057 [Saltwater crocodilepox virus]
MSSLPGSVSPPSSDPLNESDGSFLALAVLVVCIVLLIMSLCLLFELIYIIRNRKFHCPMGPETIFIPASAPPAMAMISLDT